MHSLNKVLKAVGLQIEMPFLLDNSIMIIDIIGDLYYLDVTNNKWVFCEDMTLGLLIANCLERVKAIPYTH